jgi:superfamily II DNA/RNA helicase
LTIDQGLVRFKPSRKDQTFAEKRDILRALIRSEGEGCTNAIVFCNRKVDVDVVAKSLKKHGFDAAPIHGDLDQSVRTRTLDGFRDGSIRLLIASDVAARGLDVPAVSHVFNFDVPSHPEDYIHRIGRTGRAGRKGRAITIASPADEKYLAAILDLIKMEIPPMDNPVKLKEAPTETAQGVDPEAGRSEKPARARSRTASRGKGSKATVAETAVDAAQDIATTVAVEQSQPAPEPPERQIESQIERPADPATVPAAQPQQTAQDQGRSREPNRRPAPRSGARNDNTRRDDRVVGMGDHVPDFLMRSFQPAAES